MKVLDLQCEHGHVFEGWFGSEADFQQQLARALVECPSCGNASITKRLSAPRINLGAKPSRNVSASSAEHAAAQGGLPSQPVKPGADSGAPSGSAAASLTAAHPLAVSGEPGHASARQPASVQASASALDKAAQLARTLPPEALQALQHNWVEWSQEVAKRTEDVGTQFAEEARRMHYGEVKERPIRGQATPDQAMELADEGIDLLPLALPAHSKETLQ